MLSLLDSSLQISGEPHTSASDPKTRVSGQVFKDGKRLTSIHAYEDGVVQYSKLDINDAQEE
jgi:hypothetical protein